MKEPRFLKSGTVLSTIMVAVAGSSAFVIWRSLTSLGWENLTLLPLFVAICVAAALIANAGSMIILGFYAKTVVRRYGQISFPILFVLTPVLAIITWYGYDYLVPSFRWYTDESPDFEHGLSVERFLYALAFEVSVVAVYWLLIKEKQSPLRDSA